jgi:hypothetical protein
MEKLCSWLRSATKSAPYVFLATMVWLSGPTFVWPPIWSARLGYHTYQDMTRDGPCKQQGSARRKFFSACPRPRIIAPRSFTHAATRCCLTSHDMKVRRSISRVVFFLKLVSVRILLSFAPEDKFSWAGGAIALPGLHAMIARRTAVPVQRR